MAADPANALHFLFPFLLCLIGFHEVLFHSTPWKKTISWCAFQGGLALFLFQIASPGNPTPIALALLTLAVTLAVGVLLGVFSVKLKGRNLSEGGKSPRRSPK